MSHFAVMVIGDDVDRQLEAYDENIEVEPRCLGEVSDSTKEEMLHYYKKAGYDFKTFDECYEAKGNDWDGGRLKKNEDGVWCEYSTYNPDSKWDCYVIGGRWSGAFIRLKDGCSGEEGESGAFGNKTGIDSARKGDIDFRAIRKEADEKARERYNAVLSMFNGDIPKPQYTWDEIINGEEFASLDIEARRQMYHNQDEIKRWNEVLGKDAWKYDIEKFQCTEDEYAERARLLSFTPYAVVFDGEWIERGQMGWWGISTGDMEIYEWAKIVNDIVDSLSDDTLITFVDCHI